MTAAEKYATHIDAVAAQRVRLYGEETIEDPWGGPMAQVFRFDPLRELGPSLDIIASYVQPQDVLIDAGGGAGRVSLPLSRRCREVINVDSSPGMGAEYESLAKEAGLTNARLRQANWLDAAGIQGDVVFCADVTYFMRDIVPFIQKLNDAAQRRVMITLWSVPPPNRMARLFQLVHGEEQEAAPGHPQLLGVLWEMGLLPDIHVMPEAPWWASEIPQSRERAVEMALESRWLKDEDQTKAASIVESHFPQLFEETAGHFRPLWIADARELLVTWET